MRLLLTIVFALAFNIYTSSQDRVTGRDFATRSEVIARSGMAATSQPLATQVALDILKKGGNAIDAAIAANAVLGLVEPTGAGIGGDLFAIIWSADKGKLYGLNASGRSPRSLKFEYFQETDTLYIDIKESVSVESKEISQGIVLDFDENGQLTGIEIDNAKKVANLSRFETKSLPVSDLILA